MKLFCIFIINLAVSLFVSILLYKLFKIDVSPTIISIGLIVAYMFLPQRFHDWISEK
jgi:uncharacterized membrane protein